MNSECDSRREKIPALALGDLSDAERRELEAHIDKCPQCRLEMESFAQTVQLLASVEDEPAPRHFLITPDEATVYPWRFFLQMPFRWRAALAGTFFLVFILTAAALSQFEVRIDPEGWSAGFGRGEFNTAVFSAEFLKAAAEENQKNQQRLMEEVRSEIARLQADEDHKTRHMEEILLRLDSKIDGRVERSEEQLRQDTQMLVAVLYQELARQRARDIEAINLRLESAELREYFNTRKTEEVLLTVLRSIDMNF
jgi:hypothetical protein